MSMLTSAVNQGKVAHRDALVKELCWLTGTTSEASIPPSLRRNPSLFFAMWENLSSKAQKMITEATKPGVPAVRAADLFTAAAGGGAKAEGTPDPGLTAAGGTEASTSASAAAKSMLASLMLKDKVVKTKRISVPVSLSALKDLAISTFDLSCPSSDLAFEVCEGRTKDL